MESNGSSLNMCFGEFTPTSLSLWVGYIRNWTFKISILFFFSSLLHLSLPRQKLTGAFKAERVLHCQKHLFENENLTESTKYNTNHYIFPQSHSTSEYSCWGSLFIKPYRYKDEYDMAWKRTVCTINHNSKQRQQTHGRRANNTLRGQKRKWNAVQTETKKA